MKAFIDDLVALCNKHNVVIGGDDAGLFVINNEGRKIKDCFYYVRENNLELYRETADEAAARIMEEAKS